MNIVIAIKQMRAAHGRGISGALAIYAVMLSDANRRRICHCYISKFAIDSVACSKPIENVRIRMKMLRPFAIFEEALKRCRGRFRGGSSF